jgi:glycosyltransferase involved in cell wall biosynthesis
MLLDFANRAFEHDIALRVVTPLDGPLVRILKNIGVPTAVVPAPPIMLRGSQQVGHLRSLPATVLGVWRWSRSLSEHEFVREADVLYSIAFKPHLALALSRSHPVVWHLHEFPPETTGRWWRRLAKWVPDGMIANSEVVGRAWSAEKRVPETARQPDLTGAGGVRDGTVADHAVNITVVPNGINLDRFKPVERSYWIHDRLRIPREHRIIGMPAVFARWKGQLEVIRAFESITDQYPEVHLVIVGGSIYDTLAEKQYGKELMLEIDRAATGEWAVVTTGAGSRELGVANGEQGAIAPGLGGFSDASETKSDESFAVDVTAPGSALPRLHHLPFQSKVEIAYPEFDFAVHYSTRPEPFGRVVVEAMACGIPVIAANEGGPVEILGGGIGSRREAGWLAEPRNPDALADVLRSALNLPGELARSIGEAGRRRAEDYYSWRRFAGEVADVLKLVSRSKAT